MKTLLLGMALLLPLSGYSREYVMSPEYYSVKKMALVEVTSKGEKQVSASSFEQNDSIPASAVGLPQDGQVSEDPIAQGGRIVALIKDIVALGKEIYQIVNQGRPTVKVESVPLSVIPYVNGAPVDMFEMENWTAPVSKKYKLIYKNGFNMDVVTFEYTVVYAYGGSYQGHGKYLTSVQIIPARISVKYGFNFDAAFKLQSIQNHGSKQDPMAGATLNLHYNINSIMSNEDTNDTFHISGDGKFTVL